LVSSLEGENSIVQARLLLDQAIYLARFHDVVRSLEPAQACTNILISRNDIDRQPHRLKSLIAGNMSAEHMMEYYLSLVRPVPLGTVDQAKFNDLEYRFLSWYRTHHLAREHFDLLVKIADQYHAAGRFSNADRLYKDALKLVITEPSRFGRLSSLNNSIRTADWVVLVMAKTASNSICTGNVDEAATIATNCLKLMDPYSNWWPTGNYSGTVDELIYAFGPIKKKDRTPPVRKVLSSLTDLLESGRLSHHEPYKLSEQYLAELLELQGDLRSAERYYKTAAETTPCSGTWGGLAAFYSKIGKYELAGPLFHRAEEDSQRDYARKNPTRTGGTFITAARLKRLLDCTPDQSMFGRFSWLKPVQKDIAESRTSYELGRRHLILDLRPIISDCRKPGDGTGGTVCMVKDLRKEFGSLSDEKRKLAKTQFQWFDICFPKSFEKETQYVTLIKESLPSTPVSGSLDCPHSPAGLVPWHIMIISNGDNAKLQKLFGRKLKTTKNILHD
jgi:tetratricopeptide (TPR) repeat protein